MKIAIVTRSDDNIKEMSQLTHPFMKKYANMCNADFILLDQDPIIWTQDNKPHYRILKCKDLLNKYDRIAILDTDMLVLSNCPNIFDEVPYDCIGSIFEDRGTKKNDRLDRINAIQNKWGDIGWREGYTNAGTFIVSGCHSNIFDAYKGQYWLDNGSVDLHLSYLIRKNKYKIHELSYKWNHMTMFSENWNSCADRFESYIIHYAGRGIFDRNVKTRCEQIKKDIKKHMDSIR